MEEVAPPSKSSEGRSVIHGRYEMRRVIGQGTFGKVHMARNLLTGKSVAIKVVHKEKVLQVGMAEQVKREIPVMKLVRHPSIVELHEVMASRSKIYFVLELVGGGELFTQIARSGRLREDAARNYFRLLVSAVDFCHGRGVFHCDLKLENLLLNEQGNLKVSDFGLSAVADDYASPDALLNTACGTPAYVAPEVFGKRGYDGAKADLWSCGVILFTLLAGFLPFQDENILMYKKIRRGDFRCPPWLSPDARRLVLKLLDPNPNTRITADMLMESPWFKKYPLPKAARPAVAEGSKERAKKEGEEPERLNAFHLIWFSEGFDLSPLFKGGERLEEEIRFATPEPASAVVARLEAVAARAAGRYRVTKSSVAGVRLEGEGRGWKGKVRVAAKILAVAPSVLVVAMRRDRDAVQRRDPPSAQGDHVGFIIGAAKGGPPDLIDSPFKLHLFINSSAGGITKNESG